MTSFRTSIIPAVLALGLLVGAATNASAQATRTYVSGVGDDANPCSRTAPCKTWAGAISKTTIAGVITAMDGGGFGSLTITKSITLDGGTHLTGILASNTYGITINSSTAVVTLRNLSVEGFSASTYGVRIVAAQSVHIERCVFSGFTTQGIELNGAPTTQLTLTDVTVRGSASALMIRTGHATAVRLRSENNTNGVFVAGPAKVTVRDSSVSGSQMGFAAAYDPNAVLNIENSVSMGNNWGIVSASGAIVRVANSRIIGNFTFGLYNDGSSSIVSMGGNALVGSGLADGAFTSTITIR